MIPIYDITEIEDAVREIVRDLKVSSRIYTNRPKETAPSNDFVVVNVSGTTEDLKTYGSCIVDINLFAKDIDAFKNGKKLSAMYRKLVDGFPASKGRLLFDTDFMILGDTPDDFGFHARIIRISTTIKAI
jgi:hypothetical protein